MREHHSRASADLDASNLGTRVRLRVEHQTLRRLPESGAILVAIRIHRTRLDAVARDVEAIRSLVASMESMQPAMRRYRSLEKVRRVAVEYLSDLVTLGE